MIHRRRWRNDLGVFLNDWPEIVADRDNWKPEKEFFA